MKLPIPYSKYRKFRRELQELLRHLDWCFGGKVKLRKPNISIYGIITKRFEAKIYLRHKEYGYDTAHIEFRPPRVALVNHMWEVPYISKNLNFLPEKYIVSK